MTTDPQLLVDTARMWCREFGIDVRPCPRQMQDWSEVFGVPADQLQKKIRMFQRNCLTGNGSAIPVAQHRYFVLEQELT